MDARAGERESAPDPPLDDRVLELLRREPAALAFNGLKRTLHAHPESLARSLRRLERYGQVTHDARGYRIAEAGEPEEETPGGEASDTERVAVAEVTLAPGLAPDPLLGLLVGRWAGQLRWVGVYDRAREPLLVWSRADGPGQLLLGLDRGRLRVYAEPAPGQGADPGLNEAARELLVFALERIRGHLAGSPAPGLGIRAFGRERPRLSWGPN